VDSAMTDALIEAVLAADIVLPLLIVLALEFEL
jgi:hypothetical protein